jgi:hypothetical protein
MSEIVSVEFLEANRFWLKSYVDGKFWVCRYTNTYLLQADETLTRLVEYDGNIEQLTQQDFIDTIAAHNDAINQ